MAIAESPIRLCHVLVRPPGRWSRMGAFISLPLLRVDHDKPAGPGGGAVSFFSTSSFRTLLRLVMTAECGVQSREDVSSQRYCLILAAEGRFVLRGNVSQPSVALAAASPEWGSVCGRRQWSHRTSTAATAAEAALAALPPELGAAGGGSFCTNSDAGNNRRDASAGGLLNPRHACHKTIQLCRGDDGDEAEPEREDKRGDGQPRCRRYTVTQCTMSGLGAGVRIYIAGRCHASYPFGFRCSGSRCPLSYPRDDNALDGDGA